MLVWCTDFIPYHLYLPPKLDDKFVSLSSQAAHEINAKITSVQKTEILESMGPSVVMSFKSQRVISCWTLLGGHKGLREHCDGEKCVLEPGVCLGPQADR